MWIRVKKIPRMMYKAHYCPRCGSAGMTTKLHECRCISCGLTVRE